MPNNVQKGDLEDHRYLSADGDVGAGDGKIRNWWVNDGSSKIRGLVRPRHRTVGLTTPLGLRHTGNTTYGLSRICGERGMKQTKQKGRTTFFLACHTAKTM